MMWQKILAFGFCGLLSAAGFAKTSDFTFSPAEHVALGDEVNLHLNNPVTDLLPLPNGLNFSYGSILSMGDFYGIAGKPISKGQSEEEREARFFAAFNSFAVDAASLKEAAFILGIIENEKKYIEDGLKNGETEEDLYKKVGLDYDRQFNCATGGGCIASTWWMYPGRYLTLAKDNFDHFGENAVIAYKTGHKLALLEAISGHKTHDLSKLKMAYAMNAFACHFLSDRFSTGHMRTPRQELFDYVTPSVVGSLLAGFMHNEESVYGLHVHNARAEQWVAYGDKSYFSDKTAEHRAKQLEALQFSVDQVYYAYTYGLLPNNDIDDMLPVPDEIGGAGNVDIASMFYWNEQTKKVMRRLNLKEQYDMKWTDNWWGWSTLVELGGGDMIPVLAQAELARSEYSSQAVELGLIKDKNILDYLKTVNHS